MCYNLISEVKIPIRMKILWKEVIPKMNVSKMKVNKILCVLLALAVSAVLLIGCTTEEPQTPVENDPAENPSVEGDPSEKEPSAEMPDHKPEEEAPADKEVADAGKPNLGDCHVEIKAVRLVEDYSGEPVVIVTYAYTNYDNDPHAFWLTVNDNVYQDGIGLNESYLAADDAVYSSDNQMKEIKTGATLDVDVAYKLNDTTTDLEIEISANSLFSTKKVTKVFSLGNGDIVDGGDKKPAQEKEDEASESNLGNYNIEIKSCRIVEDYEGKAVAIVTFAFTNNDNDSQAFWLAVEDHAYQDGIGLSESYFVADDVDYSSDNQMKEIKPGATLDVEVAYELNDETTDVEIEVSEYFSFNDKKITKTFKIAE